ncbi:unnamed protein product [Protopolystoma xenopodis]|uniref:Armadillo repeat-containing domain-containing protein n=1 Tax=Protopolystoma xenopodis TaxID=117903 RepID=A0A3S5FGN6_9PLAT|nr:unnamed protein product [Protopolystoma xenopodis]
MRNLSDQAFQQPDMHDLLLRLVLLLQSSEEHVATCAAGCICNLTCQNADNKSSLIELGQFHLFTFLSVSNQSVRLRGVPVLCQTLIENADHEEVTEPVCSALRHVTHRNPHYEAAIYQVTTNIL